jgi:hypothetical protein
LLTNSCYINPYLFLKETSIEVFSVGQEWAGGDHHMITSRISGVWGIILLTITIFSLSLPAHAKYSGGIGEPNDPYQIASAEDLIALGESPKDYYKYFILTRDIDLAGYVFDKAIIAPYIDPNDTGEFQGTSFTGSFDGNGHVISHLTIDGGSYLGLFGQLKPGSSVGEEVKNVGVVDANITGDDYVGGIVGYNSGSIANSYSSGSVAGTGGAVGGLVGYNAWGMLTECHSAAFVSGGGEVGGLIGLNWVSTVTRCYSTGSVSGNWDVGGLVGLNDNRVMQGTWTGFVVSHCYSTAVVIGDSDVGGLVGTNGGDVSHCYSAGTVISSGEGAGERL